MRLDKYLKVSRLIKRRTVANEACDAGRVMVNSRVAKASQDVKVGDIIEIAFGNKSVRAEVLVSTGFSGSFAAAHRVPYTGNSKGGFLYGRETGIKTAQGHSDKSRHLCVKWNIGYLIL